MSNVKIIKFTDGEEVLAEVLANSEKVVVFKDAVRIIILPPTQENPKPTIAFSAFLPYTKGEFEVKREHVFLVAEPVQDMVDQWKEVFGKGTKIWMPPKPSNDAAVVPSGPMIIGPKS